MAIVHSERADQEWWLLLLLRLLTLLMVLLFAWMAWDGMPSWQGLLVAAFLCSWALLAFQEMRFELTEDALVAWFWPFRSALRYVDIASVEVKAKAPWWVGLGCHWWKGSWWFLTRTGRYVHVLTGKGRGLAMTPKEPERLARIVRERVKQAQKAKKAR